MIFRFIAVLILLTSGLQVQAQQVTVEYEPAIIELIEDLASYHKSKERMGWRIQFYSTTDRRKMEQTIARLKKTHKNTTFSWTYNSPFYQLRAGTFAHKSDAKALLFALKREYPGAFLVQDKISVSDLRGSL